MTTPTAIPSYYDLRETFAKPGCPVCALIARDVARYLDAILYEFSVDPQIHRVFRAARGLCHVHSWQFTRVGGAAVQISVLYRAVLNEVQRVVAANQTAPAADLFARLAGRARPNPGPALAAALAPSEPCPACQHAEQAEADYLKTLSHFLPDPALNAAYRASDGLCLPHLRGLFAVIEDAERAAQVVDIQTAIWERLHADLELFSLKNRAENQHQPMGSEGDSWLRVVAAIAGRE
jgi:hypothetical protein